MASSDVDQKFLGSFARNLGTDEALLSAMLFKILGLSTILSKQLIRARRQRKLDTSRDTKSLDLHFHILWLSREGLAIVESYIIPMIANYGELKVLCYKLRASFYHIYVLFHNQPASSRLVTTPPGLPSSTRRDKGKATDRPGALSPAISQHSSLQPNHALEFGGPVRSFPATEHVDYSTVPVPEAATNFLLPAKDFTSTALKSFEEASRLSERLLWGSHPIRLSVKLEYAAFLFDCIPNGGRQQSRELCRRTIRDVYEAQEGMTDEMFEDANELVALLAKMMKRGRSRDGKENSGQSEAASGRGGGSGGSKGGSAGVPSEASKSTPLVGYSGSGTFSGTRTPGMDNMI